MIGNRIQQLRKEKNLSLSQLAEKTNISKSYLSSIERNIQVNPSIEILVKIASALDIEVEMLINSNQTIYELKKNTEMSLDEWTRLLENLHEAGNKNQVYLKQIITALKKEKTNRGV
jgi:XRE family transcriptional regulator, master regulator for biofilm formation